MAKNWWSGADSLKQAYDNNPKVRAGSLSSRAGVITEDGMYISIKRQGDDWVDGINALGHQHHIRPDAKVVLVDKRVAKQIER